MTTEKKEIRLGVCVTNPLPYNALIEIIDRFIKQKLTFGVIQDTKSKAGKFSIWREALPDEWVIDYKKSAGVGYRQIVEPNPPLTSRFYRIWVNGKERYNRNRLLPGT